MTTPTTAILKLISESARRLAVDTVVQTLSGSDGFERRELRQAIRKLLESGELCYSYELGNSFLVPSFNRPVSVSERVTLVPPGHKVEPKPPEVTVTLAPGHSARATRHPAPPVRTGRRPPAPAWPRPRPQRRSPSSPSP